MIRQAEEEKTAEQVGTGEPSVLAGASAVAGGAASVGPVRSAEELEQRCVDMWLVCVAFRENPRDCYDCTCGL